MYHQILCTVWIGNKILRYNEQTKTILRLCLDLAENPCLRLRFSFFFSRICETCGYCSLNSAWTAATKFDLSHFFQPINAHRVLFMDLQISLFNNFFIKNGSHSTIYTFKNYFITVFFSFQFSTLSKRTLRTLARPNASFFCFYFVCLFSFFLFYFMC